jgi:hypothetical protein
VAWKTLVGCLVIGTMLSGCSTPKERAQARERARAYEQQKIESRENGYKQACLEYGYAVGTPEFNQCVSSERRAHTAQKERQKLAAAMEKQAREAKRQAREAASDKDLQCIMDGGVPVGGTCM